MADTYAYTPIWNEMVKNPKWHAVAMRVEYGKMFRKPDRPRSTIIDVILVEDKDYHTRYLNSLTDADFEYEKDFDL